MTLVVLPRATWRAQPSLRELHTVDERRERVAFVVHWLGPRPSAVDPAERLRQAQSYHQRHHGWSDVGYNLAIGLDGSCWEGRGWAAVGAHSDGWNRKAYGCVVLMGDGDVVDARALDALAGAYWQACARSGRQLQLLDHGGTTGDTACAGPQLRAVVASWRDRGVPTAVPATVLPPNVAQPAPAPPYPGRPLFVVTRSSAARAWQQRMAARGWSVVVDGVYGKASERACRAFQAEKGLTVDGKVGPVTWRATWAAAVTR